MPRARRALRAALSAPSAAVLGDAAGVARSRQRAPPRREDRHTQDRRRGSSGSAEPPPLSGSGSAAPAARAPARAAKPATVLVTIPAGAVGQLQRPMTLSPPNQAPRIKALRKERAGTGGFSPPAARADAADRPVRATGAAAARGADAGTSYVTTTDSAGRSGVRPSTARSSRAPVTPAERPQAPRRGRRRAGAIVGVSRLRPRAPGAVGPRQRALRPPAQARARRQAVAAAARRRRPSPPAPRLVHVTRRRDDHDRAAAGERTRAVPCPPWQTTTSQAASPGIGDPLHERAVRRDRHRRDLAVGRRSTRTGSSAVLKRPAQQRLTRVLRRRRGINERLVAGRQLDGGAGGSHISGPTRRARGHARGSRAGGGRDQRELRLMPRGRSRAPEAEPPPALVELTAPEFQAGRTGVGAAPERAAAPAGQPPPQE